MSRTFLIPGKYNSCPIFTYKTSIVKIFFLGNRCAPTTLIAALNLRISCLISAIDCSFIERANNYIRVAMKKFSESVPKFMKNCYILHYDKITSDHISHICNNDNHGIEQGNQLICV